MRALALKLKIFWQQLFFTRLGLDTTLTASCCTNEQAEWMFYYNSRASSSLIEAKPESFPRQLHHIFQSRLRRLGRSSSSAAPQETTYDVYSLVQYGYTKRAPTGNSPHLELHRWYVFNLCDISGHWTKSSGLSFYKSSFLKPSLLEWSNKGPRNRDAIVVQWRLLLLLTLRIW